MPSSTFHVHHAQTVCLECRRRERNHQPGRLPFEPQDVDAMPMTRPDLSNRQVAHRRRMLDFASRERSRAASR